VANGPDDRQHCVLVLETEPVLRLLLLDLLQDEGVTGIPVATEQDAITTLETRADIRIVIADIPRPTPESDGLIFSRTVRHRWPPVEIILTSSYSWLKQHEIPARAVFFSKPYPVDTLLHTVNTMMAPAF